MINNQSHIRASIVILWVAVLVLSACRKEVKHYTDAVSDRANMPVLETHNVTTLISDSGITRYRVTAPIWTVYDKSNPPHWEFEKGVFLEQFDYNLDVAASIQADYAYYNEEMQMWFIKGNVHSMNREGEHFYTPELYWSQKEERIFSDKEITIVKETSTIQGIGFESNQDMTQYTIKHPTGYFPVKED